MSEDKAALEREVVEVGKRAGLRAAANGATSDEQRAVASAAEAKARAQVLTGPGALLTATLERLTQHDNWAEQPPPPVTVRLPCSGLTTALSHADIERLRVAVDQHLEEEKAVARWVSKAAK